MNERKCQEVVVICLLLALHLSNGSPVFIEKFNLEISVEWLHRLGSVNDGTNNELSDMTSDVMEWLSSLPDMGSVMDFDEYGSTSQALLNGESNAEHSNDSSVPNKVQLLLQTNRKATNEKAATAPMKDCTNNVNRNRFIAPVSSPECEKVAKVVIPANTQANSN